LRLFCIPKSNLSGANLPLFRTNEQCSQHDCYGLRLGVADGIGVLDDTGVGGAARISTVANRTTNENSFVPTGWDFVFIFSFPPKQVDRETVSVNVQK